MNKSVKNAIYAGILVVLIAGFIYFGTREYGTSTKTYSDKEIMQQNYQSLDTNNIYKPISANDVVKLVDSGTGILVLCDKNSAWCDDYVSMVNEVVKSTTVEEIFYYDIPADYSKTAYEYQKILVATKKYLPKTSSNEYLLLTPSLFILDKGMIKYYNNETALTSGDITETEYWTVERVTAFKDTLKLEIEKILK